MNIEVQTYLTNCEFYLMHPEHIEPNELAKYLATSSHYGVNDHLITSLVQRYFYLNFNHPDLLRYIQLLDRLIKYSFPLPRSLVNMFATCFRQSVENGRKSIQEELKILRKIWTPVLNQNIIEQLRREVYRITQIDIQMQLREQSKRFLSQYFQKNMSLSRQQILEILYKRAPSMRFQQQRLISEFEPVKGKENFSIQSRKNPKIREEEPTKVERGRKLTQRQASLLLYDKIRNLNSFSCKQCGKYFQTEHALLKHRDEHFEERMRKYRSDREGQILRGAKIPSKKVVRMESCVDSWCFVGEEMSGGIGVGLDMDRRCYFCGEEAEKEMIDDCLVFKNTIEVKLSLQPEEPNQLMHRPCWKTLINSGTQ